MLNRSQNYTTRICIYPATSKPESENIDFGRLIFLQTYFSQELLCNLKIDMIVQFMNII